MANEIIRPSELPVRTNPVPSEVVPSDNNVTVAGVSWEDGVNAAVPPASQAEAEAGIINSKRLTPLTGKQAIDAQVPPKISAAIAGLNLGSMSQETATDYTKTADLAAVALSNEYGDLSGKPTLGTAAATAATDYATAAQKVPAGGSTGQVLAKASSADNDVVWTAAGVGDMLTATYDPQAIDADAFDRANHTGTQAIATVEGLQDAVNTQSGAWEIVETINRAGQADIIIRDLEAYTSLRISGYALPVTDDAVLGMEFSTDNGATWLTGAADYTYQLISASNAALVGPATGDATYIDLGASAQGNVLGEGIRFTATVDAFNKDQPAFCQIEVMSKNGSGIPNVAQLAVWANGTTKRRAIRFRFSSGDIANANLIIEGRRDDMRGWRKVPADWEYPPKQVRSAVVWNGKVIFGSDGLGQPGLRAEIWEKTPIGLRRRSQFPGAGVQTMAVGPDNALYVGTGTSLGGTCSVHRFFEPNTLKEWYWDPSASNYEDLRTFSADHVWCSTFHDGKWHVGLLNNDNPGVGQLWRFDDPGWTLIGEPGLNGWPSGDTGKGVYELISFEGELWASTFGSNDEEGMVLRLTDSGWVVVPTDPTWIPLAFAVYDGKLVVALHNYQGNIANPIQYWNGSAFVPLGTAPAYFGQAVNYLPNHMTVGPDGNLYVGWGGYLGTLTVWRYNGTAWKQIGGDGLNGSWVNPVASAPATSEWFYRLIAHGNKLYACVAPNSGAFGAVWEYQLH